MKCAVSKIIMVVAGIILTFAFAACGSERCELADCNARARNEGSLNGVAGYFCNACWGNSCEWWECDAGGATHRSLLGLAGYYCDDCWGRVMDDISEFLQ